MEHRLLWRLAHARWSLPSAIRRGSVEQVPEPAKRRRCRHGRHIWDDGDNDPELRRNDRLKVFQCEIELLGIGPLGFTTEGSLLESGN